MRLLSSAGFPTETFTSGAEFLHSIGDHAPQCVVLNLHKPELGGFEVQHQLLQRHPDVRVVVITGFDARRVWQKLPGSRSTGDVTHPRIFPDKIVVMAIPAGDRNETDPTYPDVCGIDRRSLRVRRLRVQAPAVVLAPKGAMPGGVVATPSEVTATVTGVDAKTRKVTLQFVDGTNDTVMVGKAVDLSKVSPGDTVTVRLTESIAIAVEKT
jgi:CheY-like chemotaxis protein